MKKKGRTVLIVIIAAVVLIGILVAGQYNSLVRADEQVNQAWSNVETQYQRRVDLIPNLVETVNAYASHESEVYTEVAKVRANYQEAKTPADYQAADQSLNRMINIAVEAYPELKASENFLRLQDELAGTENRIAVARKDYNAVATNYNRGVRAFPKNIFAGIFGFERHELFQAAAGAEQAPTVNFK